MGTALANGGVASLADPGEILLGGEVSPPTRGNPSADEASPDLRHAPANTNSNAPRHQASGVAPAGIDLNTFENMYFAPIPHRRRWIGDRAAFRDIS